MSPSRPVSLACASLLMALVALAAGCAEMPGDESATGLDPNQVSAIPETPVGQQTIGNCWIYATTGWVEALRAQYTGGAPVELSKAYLTFWDWYDKITTNQLGRDGALQPGGPWGRAADMILRRGLVAYGSFVREEVDGTDAARQQAALSAINAALARGVLRSPEARRDGALVFATLVEAFGLDDAVVAELEARFGSDGRGALPAVPGSRSALILHPALYLVGPARDDLVTNRTHLTLSEVLGTAAAPTTPDARTGRYAWSAAAYPVDGSSDERRAFVRRIQRALNDDNPLPIGWYVDTDAQAADGAFRASAAPGGAIAPRTLGYPHESLLVDYVADDVPGYGTVSLGWTSRDARDAALEGTVRFLHVKNSWGINNADALEPGYNDLYMDYVDAPIAAPSGGTQPAARGLGNVVLPPGY